MRSVAGFNKNLSNFLQQYRFWPFLATKVHLQSKLPQRTGKKSLVSFLKKVAGNIVFNFEFSVFKKVRVATRFASRYFPEYMILASYNFVGRHLVACYTCSIFFLCCFDRPLIASSAVVFYLLFVDQ